VLVPGSAVAGCEVSWDSGDAGRGHTQPAHLGGCNIGSGYHQYPYTIIIHINAQLYFICL